ncbi:MAG: FHA domain-containing protein, partial [Deltaproteobacteria bacterium]|nr:FHA domain-containing protein [Deltaproteobacteria bacterium]
MSLALTVVVLDTQSNQSFERSFDRFPVRIGRNQLAELQIDRPYVSQFHVALEVADSRMIVRDLGSTNGTVHNGQKLVRDQAIDVTGAPEVKIGPLQIRLRIQDVEASPASAPRRQASVLDLGTPAGQGWLERRRQPLAPGQEDPFVRQLVPYIEAYRSSWANVYRLIYEHLPRLQPEVRERYLKRILTEHPALAQELDFQRVAQYFGVPAHEHGELTPPLAAMAALQELSSQLAPGAVPLDSAEQILSFARRLRDSMEVFLKCFVSLRDGYQEFEAEVLRRERLEEQGNHVGAAPDHRSLGQILFAENASSEQNCHQLH